MLNLLEYTFFQHAVIAALFSCVLCGFIGTYVVSRRMALVGGGIAHSSLGGVGLGAWLGFPPLLGAAVFALLSGFAIRFLSRKRKVREDSAIAMIWTLGMSVGIIASYLAPAFLPELPSFLFGDILTVTEADIIALAVLTIITAVFFMVFMPQIIAVAFDYDYALSQRIPARFIDGVMTALVSLSVVACLHMVGIVLVIALLSVPQMTANLLTENFKKMIVLSTLIGLVDCMAGFLLSIHLNVPSGASIIFVSIVIYIAIKAIIGISSALK